MANLLRELAALYAMATVTLKWLIILYNERSELGSDFIGQH